MSTHNTRSGLAITSMVLGILSMMCLGVMGGIPAIILGHVAHNRARKRPAEFGGGGMAIAGFVTGYLSLVTTLILLGLLLPALAKAKSKAQTINCVNNMKNIGLAFRVWATDHGEKFPFEISTNEGGTLELCDRDFAGFDNNGWMHLRVMSNELSTPKVLVCPGDGSKRPASSFASLGADNVSYEVRSGEEVNVSNPSEVLARCPIHNTEAHTDGSVQQRGWRR